MQVVAAPPESLTHGFLLIEPATLAHATALAAFDMRPCTPRILAHREELMPRLIDVAALNEAARITVTEAWEAEIVGQRPPVVCAWLDSDLDGDSLARHIARYLVGPGVDGKPVFWRFYDPRVLALTLAIFDPSQRQALLGPIQAWQFIWAGHRWAVSGPGIPTDVLEGNVPAWPRPDQWARINRSDAAPPKCLIDLLVLPFRTLRSCPQRSIGCSAMPFSSVLRRPTISRTMHGTA
ncbi:hypothetical protein FEP95_05342 [Burkholderia multivorans]|nr:hypothetical protein [Burkholderia multivorans]MDR8810241.1 hypothetical protein [Burkholderia multivorans]